MRSKTFPGDKVPSDVVYGSVENARSALTGALAGLGQGGWQGNYNSGIGFGLTETYLTGDALAEDYVLSGSGSGWMWQTYSYNVKSWFDDPRLQCSTTWNCYYTTINSCNNLIGSAELLETSAEGKNILGQAYVLRAFCYHMLAQVYARAYYYYPDDLCVPLYLEPTTSETKGAARSTNKQVYEEVIYPDLTTGVGLLEEAAAAGIARSSKTEIDYYVANGIKARVALTMHKWSDAYKAAEEAPEGVCRQRGARRFADHGRHERHHGPAECHSGARSRRRTITACIFRSRPRWTPDTTAMPRRPAAAALRGFGTA